MFLLGHLMSADFSGVSAHFLKTTIRTSELNYFSNNMEYKAIRDGEVNGESLTKCPGTNAKCPFRLSYDPLRDDYKCWNGHTFTTRELFDARLRIKK